MNNTVKELLRTVGLDIGRYRSRRSLDGFLEVVLTAYDINVVIDVGANIGQYARKVRKLGFVGEIVSFEPIPSTYSLLVEMMGKDMQWRGFNKALGREPGVVQMVYEPGQTDMASLYSPSKSVPEILQRWEAAKKEEVTVQMETLDTLFSECVARISKPNVFLKCDTQGHDLDVLQGGLCSLPHISVVQIEVPVVHLYDNLRSFGEIMNAIREMDFLPCAFYPVTTIGREGITVLEFDCLAVRSSRATVELS